MHVLRLETRQILALLFLAVVILWLLIEKEVLYSVDGPVYTLIAKELSQRPFSEWTHVTWFGKPFYDTPHLHFWLLALSMKLFGYGTFSALLPSLLFGTLCVPLVYLLGRRLYDHQHGLLSGFILVLTPLFVKTVRNPMIESLIMFFIFLSIYYGYVGLSDKKLKWVAGSGLFFGLAFLAKGPPALLVPGMLGVMGLYQIIFNKKSNVSAGKNFLDLILKIGCILLIGTTLIALIDFWHFTNFGYSFYKRYFHSQILGALTSDVGSPWKFDPVFFKEFLHNYWPWMPLIWLSVPLAVWKKDKKAYSVCLFGISVILLVLAGFSLPHKKNPWYATILLPGFALLAGISLREMISTKTFDRWFTKICLTLTLPVLFLCALFPTIFEYNRDGELFISGAAKVVGNQLQGQSVAVCIPLNHWTGPSLISYYLGAQWTPCDTGSTVSFKIVRSRNAKLECGYKDLYSGNTFSLLEKVQ